MSPTFELSDAHGLIAILREPGWEWRIEWMEEPSKDAPLGDRWIPRHSSCDSDRRATYDWMVGHLESFLGMKVRDIKISRRRVGEWERIMGCEVKGKG